MRIEFKFDSGSLVLETFGTWMCERTLQLTEFFTVYTKLEEMAVMASKDLTTETKNTPSGARPDAKNYNWFSVQCLTN